MIGKIVGEIEFIDLDLLLLMTKAGVGYEISICSTAISQKFKKGDKIELFTTTIMRDNEISLYGFLTKKEKDIFQKLLSVSGIGPRTAKMMIADGAKKVEQAVLRADLDFLASIKGIGKKSAQRLILELQGKLKLSPEVKKLSRNLSEAAEALGKLGFDKKNISEFLQKADKDLSAEQIVESFLRRK